MNSVIMTEWCKEAMDALLNNRDDCGVLPTNEYFFAVPGYSTFLQSSTVLSKFKTQFGVSDMETRKIRKLIATLIQAKPGLLPSDQLARHLGHELSVHNEFYR